MHSAISYCWFWACAAKIIRSVKRWNATIFGSQNKTTGEKLYPIRKALGNWFKLLTVWFICLRIVKITAGISHKWCGSSSENSNYNLLERNNQLETRIVLNIRVNSIEIDICKTYLVLSISRLSSVINRRKFSEKTKPGTDSTGEEEFLTSAAIAKMDMYDRVTMPITYSTFPHFMCYTNTEPHAVKAWPSKIIDRRT